MGNMPALSLYPKINCNWNTFTLSIQETLQKWWHQYFWPSKEREMALVGVAETCFLLGFIPSALHLFYVCTFKDIYAYAHFYQIQVNLCHFTADMKTDRYYISLLKWPRVNLMDRFFWENHSHLYLPSEWSTLESSRSCREMNKSRYFLGKGEWKWGGGEKSERDFRPKRISATEGELNPVSTISKHGNNNSRNSVRGCASRIGYFWVWSVG